jgi:uncharacterized membrane protein YbhN (UPF0104 family)
MAFPAFWYCQGIEVFTLAFQMAIYNKNQTLVKSRIKEYYDFPNERISLELRFRGMKVTYFKQLLRWIILVIILSLLGKYIIEHRQDFSFLSTLRLSSLMPIVLLALLSQFLGVFRYFLVIRETENSVPFIDVFRHLIVARFLNKLLPQSGIFYRAHAFKKENDVSYGSFIASFAAFVWLDLVLTIIITTGIVAFYQPNLSVNNYPILPVLFAFTILLLCITIFSHRIPNHRKSEIEANPNIGYLLKTLNRLIGYISFTFELARKPRLLLSGGLIILTNTAISIWIKFFVFQLIGVTTKVSELTLFVVLNKVSNLLVVTPGNLGVMESLFGVLSVMLGIGAAQGVAAALILRAVSFLVLGCLSVTLLIFQKTKKPQAYC